MVPIEKLLRPFAESIFCKVKGFNALKPELSQSQRQRFLEAISDDIKKCTNFIPPLVSEAANAVGKRLGVDLSSKNWHDQPAFDARRETFHWEHLVPVSVIRDLCLPQDSADGVADVLIEQLRVAWILKSEDKKLNGLGFRSKRPDWNKAYAAAGIQLPSCPYAPRRGAVAVVLRGERLLVIRRSAHVVAPRAFCFPGGAIEPGETQEQALMREMTEELGVTARPLRRVWQSVTPWKVELSWWLSQLSPDAVLQPNPAEVESVHWFTPGEMLALGELLESNRQFLQRLAAGDIDLN